MGPKKVKNQFCEFLDFWHFRKIWKCKSRFWKRFRQPFVDLINSKDCINLCDLLNLTDRQKVAKTFSKNTIYYKNWKFACDLGLGGRKIMNMKKVQATFCRSVKFKTSHRFIQSFAFNRSTKGGLNLFQKHDLHQTFFRRT